MIEMEHPKLAVPELYDDGKINWDTLRKVLIEDLEEGSRKEYSSLNYPGTRESANASLPPA